jgi:hypothetical protein
VRLEHHHQIRGGFVFWGVWPITFGLIFSKMSRIPHTAYMASLAPPLAALSAAGVVAAVIAIVVLAGAKLTRRTQARLVPAGRAAGVVAMLAATTTWAASVLDERYAGSSFNASAPGRRPAWAGTESRWPTAGPSRSSPDGTASGTSGEPRTACEAERARPEAVSAKRPAPISATPS